jgi:putative membrane protein
MAHVTTYLSTLPSFLLYFAVSLILFAAFVAIYTWVTPYHEFALINQGNIAAAVSLSGAALGFVVPLASVIVHSLSVVDMLVWSIVAMLAQLALYLVARLAMPRLADDITAGRAAPALLLAALSLSIGILNAACITY